MTLHQFHVNAAQIKAQCSHLRWGQVYFNLLVDINPIFAESLRGTPFDPFYLEDPVGFEQDTQGLSDFRQWLAGVFESIHE